MLSYGLWQRVFGSDRNVLGRVVKLDDEAYTVIGVLPREAVFPDRVELRTPLAADPNAPSGYYLSGIGRLKAGVSIAQARADLLSVHKAMISEGHSENDITSPVLTVLRERYLGDFRVVSEVLLGAVGLVLLIACVNIAALMLVRSSFRSTQLAIRAALGASRTRIVTQLLTESAVLATLGGILGVLLGALFMRALVSLMPEMPQWISFSLDGRCVVFCVALTGAATLLFGLAPALQASRGDIRGPMQNAAGRMTALPRQRATLSGFVVSEIGLALVLSISAGLLVQSFRKVLQVDPGFRPENVLTFRLSVPDATYDEPEKKVAYYDRLLERLRALPGVKSAGAT
jgi:putative ABC transport system permease protein